MIEVSLLDGSVGFAVHPKENCPHFNLDNLEQLYESSNLDLNLQKKIEKHYFKSHAPLVKIIEKIGYA